MRTRRFLSLLISLLAITFVTSSARAAPAVNRQLWDRVLETGNANTLALSPDGATAYVAGCNGFCDGKLETVAYSVSTGQLKWSSIFKTTKQSGANDVTVSPDGTKVYVTGVARYSFDNYDDFQTIAYDAATGVVLWTARYDFPAHDTDVACCIQVSPDGSQVFVTGESWSDQTSFDYATVAYDAATGAQEWVTRYNGPIGGGRDDPTALGVSPDGTKVFVTGGSPGQDLYDDYATVAYDAATGTQLWVSRFNNPSLFADTAYDLAVSPDGSRVVVTGNQTDFVNGDAVTIAYDAGTGTQLWLSTYDAHGEQAVAKSVGVSPDSSLVFVTGYRATADNSDYVTIAYDAATGAQVWLRTIPGSRER